MPKLKPSDIKDFPDIPHARIIENGGHVYVVVVKSVTYADGSHHRQVTTYGKVVDGQYYPMAEYRRLFTASGQRRVNSGHNRPYVRKKPLSEIKRPEPRYALDQSAEAKAKIKNYPYEIKGAVMVKIKGVIRVITRTYCRLNGRKHEERVYHGRIIDNCYYSEAEYHQLFTRKGERKDIQPSQRRRS